MELSPSAGSKPVVVSVAPKLPQEVSATNVHVEFPFCERVGDASQNVPAQSGSREPAPRESNSCEKSLLQDQGYGGRMHEIAARSGNCQFVGTSARPTADSNCKDR